jgi:DNA-binding transcriptional regulator YhcF (GntR family)
MKRDEAALRDLRDRTLGVLHIGGKAAGERLPSVRSLSRMLQEDHRAVAEIYRRLEQDGLIEIRPRSGVYVAGPARGSGGTAGAGWAWLAEFCGHALHRGLTLPELPLLLQRCVSTSGFRCVCVESVEDVRTAFCADLEEALGASTRCVDPAALRPGDAAEGLDHAAMRDELRGADCVVTTQFHYGSVAPTAAELGIPCLMISVSDEVVAAVRGALRAGTLTLVALDPAFFERFRAMYSAYIYAPGHLRTITASDRAALVSLDPAEPLLVTRAARLHLPDLPLQSLTRHLRTVSGETMRAIAELIVQRNLRQLDTPLR